MQMAGSRRILRRHALRGALPIAMETFKILPLFTGSSLEDRIIENVRSLAVFKENA